MMASPMAVQIGWPWEGGRGGEGGRQGGRDLEVPRQGDMQVFEGLEAADEVRLGLCAVVLLEVVHVVPDVGHIAEEAAEALLLVLVYYGGAHGLIHGADQQAEHAGGHGLGAVPVDARPLGLQVLQDVAPSVRILVEVHEDDCDHRVEDDAAGQHLK